MRIVLTPLWPDCGTAGCFPTQVKRVNGKRLLSTEQLRLALRVRHFFKVWKRVANIHKVSLQCTSACWKWGAKKSGVRQVTSGLRCAGTDRRGSNTRPPANAKEHHYPPISFYEIRHTQSMSRNMSHTPSEGYSSFLPRRTVPLLLPYPESSNTVNSCCCCCC